MRVRQQVQRHEQKRATTTKSCALANTHARLGPPPRHPRHDLPSRPRLQVITSVAMSEPSDGGERSDEEKHPREIPAVSEPESLRDLTVFASSSRLVVCAVQGKRLWC